MNTSFPKSRRLLDEVMAGRSIGEQLWADARRELDAADPRLDRGGKVPDPVGVPTYGDVVETLGELFGVVERYITYSRASGTLTHLNSEDSDRIIASRQVLKKCGYSPQTRRNPEAPFGIVRP